MEMKEIKSTLKDHGKRIGRLEITQATCQSKTNTKLDLLTRLQFWQMGLIGTVFVALVIFILTK